MTDTQFKELQELFPELIRLRRIFHRYPETAWHETHTTELIRSYLSELPLQVSALPIPGHSTGVSAVLNCGNGPVLTLRFDIDALPVTETTDLEHLAVREHFRSVHTGCMHACGHDGHIAIGLVTAAFLCHHRHALQGTVQFLFQPAEEGCRGARLLADSSYLDTTDFFLSGHIVPRAQYPEADGDFIFTSGSFATTKLNVTLHGKAAHAAHPQEGCSVMPALGHMISSLYALVSPENPGTILNIGTLQAGTARNILADLAVMEMELRGTTSRANAHLTSSAQTTISNTADSCGLSADIEVVGSAPALNSSADLVTRLQRYFAKPDTHLTPSGKTSTRFMASEDAAHLMEKVKSHRGQAAYVLFPAKAVGVLHQPDYSFDESVLLRAVLFYAQSALYLLRK